MSTKNSVTSVGASRLGDSSESAKTRARLIASVAPTAVRLFVH
jgi:hypothetical protein